MTKELLPAFFALLVTGQVSAQNRHQQPPTAVQQSFQRDYPQAHDPQWSSSNGEWHANFDDRSKDDRGEMVAHYSRYGHHIDSHVPYDRNDVPPAVIHGTESRYPGGREYNYTQIERPGSRPVFQVDLNFGASKKRMYVDENGRNRQYQDHHY